MTNPTKTVPLLPCGCGEVPERLHFFNEWRQAKYALVSGSCCGDWLVEYRNDYATDEDAAMSKAVEGWNECARKTMLAATPPTDLDRLAREIADEAAVESIACECSMHHTEDGFTWADISYAKDQGVNLEREVRYLKLRGLLEHHPERPELVRLKEKSDE